MGKMENQVKLKNVFFMNNFFAQDLLYS